MSGETRIVPQQLAQSIEMYVSKSLSDAERFENSEPLDDNGVFRLYILVAEAYAMGYDHGERTTNERETGRRLRERAAARREAELAADLGGGS